MSEEKMHAVVASLREQAEKEDSPELAKLFLDVAKAIPRVRAELAAEAKAAHKIYQKEWRAKQPPRVKPESVGWRAARLGNRTLLAKTCVYCCRLLPGDQFPIYGKEAKRKSYCIECNRVGARRHREAAKKNG